VQSSDCQVHNRLPDLRELYLDQSDLSAADLSSIINALKGQKALVKMPFPERDMKRVLVDPAQRKICDQCRSSLEVWSLASAQSAWCTLPGDRCHTLCLDVIVPRIFYDVTLCCNQEEATIAIIAQWRRRCSLLLFVTGRLLSFCFHGLELRTCWHVFECE